MQRTPDGVAWPSLPGPREADADSRSQVRNRWAVLTTRLAPWRDPLGCPLPPPVEAERPTRGRPRKAPRPAAPARRKRPAVVDTALAGLVAQLAVRSAARAADRAARQARRDALALPAPAGPRDRDDQADEQPTPDPSDLIRRRALLRAAIERRHRP